MPRKTDLAAQLGQRKQKSGQLPPVEPVVPTDPLKDIAQALTPATPAPGKQTRTHARTRASELESAGGITIEDLYRRLMQKRHLSSYTLRFRAEELDDLDAVAKEIEEKADGAISKNDIARAALIWLLEDYHQRGEQSVLEQVARRG